MNPVLSQLISALVYPGLLTTLVLTIAVVIIAQLDAPGGGLTRGVLNALRGQGSKALLLSALLPLVAGSFLPWPLNPVPWDNGHFWLAFGLLETSALLALAPALSQATVTGVRAAIREAQISAAGRLLLWTALGIALWSGRTWALTNGATHGLALLAAGLALPLAAGWGFASPADDVSLGGPEAGLSLADASLAQWGRALRSTVLLSAIPLLLLPENSPLPDAAMIGITVAVVVLLALWGRTLNMRSVRRPMLDILKFGWVWAVPLLVLAIVAQWLAVHL